MNARIHRAERKEVNVMSETNEASVQSVVVPRPGLFRVFRTSETRFSPNKAPCLEATACQCVKVDRRSVSDPSKVVRNDAHAWWYEKGSNHRIEKGQICRDVGYSQAWFVELTDVMEFVREYGECVLSVDNDGFDCIEIYDDYRE
jgi:hypothetical protein